MNKSSTICMILAVNVPTLVLWLAGVLPGRTALLLLAFYGILTAASFLIAGSLAYPKEKEAMTMKKVSGSRPPKTRGSWTAPSGVPPKAPPSASLAPLPSSGLLPARHFSRYGTFGVELALPAPADEVQRTIRLGVDLAADRAVTVACEIRNGVVHLLATHELDR